MPDQIPEFHDEAARFEALTAEAHDLYDQRLPYHNFEHALNVLRQAEVLIELCRAEQVPVDADVIRYAAIFHDAGFSEDHQARGFASKEAYAASLARTALVNHGLDEEVITAVERTILATHIDALQVTNEDKIIRAADIHNLQHSYEEFADANRRLKTEAEMMSGKTITWTNWKERTVSIINKFLAQDIRLTSKHDDEFGQSVFHRRTQENLQRFLADPEFTNLTNEPKP